MSAPSFNFRLERVRSLRERQEQQAKEAFAASLAHRIKGEALLLAAEDDLLAARESERGMLSGAHCAATDLLALQTWRERLERSRHAAALEVDRRETELDGRRTALVAASRDREVLERLKSRRRAEHELAAARRDVAISDELATARHVRKAAGL